MPSPPVSQLDLMLSLTAYLHIRPSQLTLIFALIFIPHCFPSVLPLIDLPHFCPSQLALILAPHRSVSSLPLTSYPHLCPSPCPHVLSDSLPPHARQLTPSTIGPRETRRRKCGGRKREVLGSSPSTVYLSL